MGTDLQTVSSHNIKFGNRSFKEIAEEIRLRLNELEFHKNPFLIHHTLWLAHYYDWDESEAEILAKKEWTYDEEFDLPDFEERRKLEFYGPFDLCLDFREHIILIDVPIMRYYLWFEEKLEKQRNEWRKFFWILINKFGSNKVIYLPDNNHKLEKYLYFEDRFSSILSGIALDFGASKQNFSEVSNDYENAYLVDEFKDLDFNEKVDFNAIMPPNLP